MEIDWNSIELRVGLEVHQQIESRRKLFCNCPPIFSEKYAYKIERKLRPSMSELGEIDPAALFEWRKGKKYIYEVPIDSACLVECDEEPPHSLDLEALKVGLAIAQYFNSFIPDEIVVMRKTVIDGSNTSGFQRTAIVALGGRLVYEGGEIGIQTIAIEEDASRKVMEGIDYTTYSLDRLGIPLIEISTAPDIKTPEQAEEVAFLIGQALRLTGKVKRGLGTIRQDLNISIRGGSKIEVKGVQKLELIPKIVRNEAMRQLNLMKIKEELKNRGLNEEELRRYFIVKDLTEELKDTNSKVLRNAISKGGVILGAKLRRLRGILGLKIQGNRTFGSEVADYARLWGKVRGLFHLDELPNYGITKEEVDSVSKALGLEELDSFIIIADQREKAIEGMKGALERLILAFNGVPKETRMADEEGITKFTRPQPGSERMYPETDIPTITVNNKLIEEAKTLVPKRPDVIVNELLSLGIRKDIAVSLLKSKYFDLFLRVINGGGEPLIAASVIEVDLKGIRREIDLEKISEEDLEKIVLMISKREIPRESLEKVCSYLIENKGIKVEDAIKAIGIGLEGSELEKMIREILIRNKEEIKKRGEKAFNYAMGLVMKELRGKAEGKKIAEIIKKQINSL